MKRSRNDSPPKEAGQGLAEVAFFLLLVVIVVVAAIRGLGTQLATMFQEVMTAFGVGG